MITPNLNSVFKKLFIVISILCVSTYAFADPYVTVTKTQDYKLQHAIDVIYSTYGDVVSVDKKAKDLLKFGRNETVSNVEPGSTIMTNIDAIDNETYVSMDEITTVSSGSTEDTQTFTIEGHTQSGNNLTFVVQSGTLNGQNKVLLTTPLSRATRFYNTSSTNFTGPIYIYQDSALTSGKPDADEHVHLMVRAGKNQSEKASTSVSQYDYWIITGFYADVLEKTASFADIRLEVRTVGKVFREVAAISASTSSRGIFEANPYIIVPKNSDVRLVAVGSADNLDVSGGISGYLALVVS